MERTSDLGATWERTPYLNDGITSELIQPTILFWDSVLIQILCRSKQARIFESWMGSDWRTWAPLIPTDLPNPNSAIDAVVLNDGRALLVYNHATIGRSPLNVAVSAHGREWKRALVLESNSGEYSYPAIIQSSDTLVHITYTWNRSHIKHVVVDPRKLQPYEM
jgi:predicted neuraminidase